MDRAIAKEPEIGLEQLGVPSEHLAEVPGAGLFLSLEEEFEVDRRPLTQRLEGIERGEHRDDR